MLFRSNGSNSPFTRTPSAVMVTASFLAAKTRFIMTAEGVRVNGELLPLSAPIEADSAGRPLPRFQAERFTLRGSELLLMSNVSGISFDGRYFGPIDRSQIKGVIRPIFRW